MKLILSYFKINFLTTVRNTPALFFTLIFPPLILVLTAHQWGSDTKSQLEAFVIYLNYSVQTVSLMLLGMAVSQEKNSHWSKYVRTLPAPVSTMVLGRLMHTLALCFINLILISVVAVFVLSIPVTLAQLIFFFGVALLGAIPMALIGMSIGYAASPESSRSIFTLLNLMLLFGSFSLPDGGLFSYVRAAVPTFQWKELSLHILNPASSIVSPLVCLSVYTILFAMFFGRVYSKSSQK